MHLPSFYFKKGMKNMAKTKKEKDPIQMEGAALIVEEMFHSGFLKTHDYLEAKKENIKSHIKEKMGEEEARREFSNGVVAKYQRYQSYQVNRIALNEYLMDLGLLPQVATIDSESIKEDANIQLLLQPFLIPQGHYIRISKNKLGKEKTLVQSYEPAQRLTLESLSQKWLRTKQEAETIVGRYDRAKKKMLRCPILASKGKLPCTFGSVSRLPLKPAYNIHGIFDELGPNFLIQFSSVNQEKLETFIYQGYIKQKEINQFRIPKGEPNLKFIVMELEAEKKMLEFHYNKMIQGAQRLRHA
jgi:hypothetical protein